MPPIKIDVLHCGRVRVDRALPFKEKTLNPVAFTGLFRNKECQIWLPVAVFLIEHPKGLILVDTGWHTDVRTDQIGHLGRFHYMLNKAMLPPGEAIHEQLERRGLKTGDLDYVILTHLHSDHASGLKLVSDAKKILVSEPEWIAANGRQKHRYIPAMWDRVDVETYRFETSDIGPQKASFDLLGDGSVQLVHVPGHTPGLAAALISRNGRHVLIFSDAGYARKSWERMIPPGTAVNRKQAMKSLEWVRDMSLDAGCAGSFASHDTAVEPYTGTL